jgi:nucleotide-binding universal stress UspA family protein
MKLFPDRILLATDGSEDAALAARVVADLSSKTGAELHVVHPELALSRLKTILYAPSRACHFDQLLQGHALPGSENHMLSDLIGICDAAPRQKPVSPSPLLFTQLQPEKRHKCPLVEAFVFGACSSREPPPPTGTHLTRQ